ncbi:MAG: chromosomal replication initiator protein DnaA [Desulfobacteraceae bacterium]|nr:MAG: chromosomal replication initiator protein DnaA [Desulfobacteraceae bacterium]
MKSLWNQVKQSIKDDIPDHMYRMWIEPVRFLDANDSHITLSSPNAFSAKRLRDNYLIIFEKAFSKLGIDDVKIDLSVNKAVTPSKEAPTQNPQGIENRTASYPALPAYTARAFDRQMEIPGLDIPFKSGRMFKKEFTFDDFVVGDNSDFAYSASLSLAQGHFTGNNILYLLSGTGLGKSHLSQAAGRHIITKGYSDSVYYVTAEDFTNEMIFSLKNNKIEQFKEKYRTRCDVLILEDIHFLAGKDATQKELAITLDYLLDANKKIIFSGCNLPDEIPKMNDQLKSRLKLGLITKIDRPNYKTRVKILKKKSKCNGYLIPEDVVEYLAQELSEDVRQLESGLNGVAARASLLGEQIDIDLARSVLETFSLQRKLVTVDRIKKLVCKEFSISEKEIISASRKQKIVKPRQMGIFLSRKYTDQPLKNIGKSFNRYHATAIYAINAVEKEIKQKGQLFEQVKYLSRKIESGNL